MRTLLLSFLVPTPSLKNGQTNTCHLSEVGDISPKQRDWETLERNSLGRKKSKLLSASGHILRNNANLLAYSIVCNMIFYPPSHSIVTTLGSTCHYSHSTVEKGGIMALQWTCMGHMRIRERSRSEDVPLPPWAQEVRKGTAHSGMRLSKSD